MKSIVLTLGFASLLCLGANATPGCEIKIRMVHQVWKSALDKCHKHPDHCAKTKKEANQFVDKMIFDMNRHAEAHNQKAG